MAMPGEPVAPTGGRDVYTVSRLNREARGLVESRLGTLWIEGEVSNFSRPASGHWYFSLKDAGAQVRCAMFRARNALAGPPPRDGTQVLLRARVSLYEPRGDFQLIVDHLEPAGEGALRRRFEELKRRLAAEGLFDAARKRPVPSLPRAVGVVTSPTGAALRDILHVLRRRFPAVPVVLYPVPVQGEAAAPRIAEAIATASARAEVDVLIVGRGGGSLEDLWPFNEEAVVRAIVAASMPVVSAVGHEVDVTLADFAADLRAPTPSAAAELVVPDAAEWLRALADQARRLAGAWGRQAARWREDIVWTRRRLEQLHPAVRLEREAQRLDELDGRLRATLRLALATRAHDLAALREALGALSPAARVAELRRRADVLAARLAPAARAALERQRSRLGASGRALHAVSPLATLERGYAIVTREDGRVLTAASGVSPGETVEARLARGRIAARVTRILPG
jgi:exodeoxyribonuclease VII large subunit